LYSFSLWCRKYEPYAFDAGEFCKGKETGVYPNEYDDEIECNNDFFDGGWVKILEQTDTENDVGDVVAT
jgi:hypothetical protein